MHRPDRRPSHTQPAQCATVQHGYLEERHFEAVVIVAAIVAMING